MQGFDPSKFGDVGQRVRVVQMKINQQPSWVTKLAFITASLVMLSVIALLVIPALVIGVFVFMIAAIVARVKASLARAGGSDGPLRNDGRSNVSVVRGDRRLR